MKYTVLGNTQVTVSIEVEADSPEDAIKKAAMRFRGIKEYASNGGTDKLIGVGGPSESIHADKPVVFDDCLDYKEDSNDQRGM